MSKIIITESGNIDSDSKARLRKQGYVIIEAKDTDKVKIVGDSDFATGNDLFMAALKGSMNDSFSQASMTRELHKRLLEAENRSGDPPKIVKTAELRMPEGEPNGDTNVVNPVQQTQTHD